MIGTQVAPLRLLCAERRARHGFKSLSWAFGDDNNRLEPLSLIEIH